MRVVAALLVVAALAGCLDTRSELLFDMHVGHDFDEAARTHGFATGNEADRIVVHLQLAPKSRDARCDPVQEPGVSVALRRTPNETLARVARVDSACRAFEEFRIPVDGSARWAVVFEGNGPFLGSADVTAEKTATSFRVPR